MNFQSCTRLLSVWASEYVLKCWGQKFGSDGGVLSWLKKLDINFKFLLDKIRLSQIDKNLDCFGFQDRKISLVSIIEAVYILIG